MADFFDWFRVVALVLGFGYVARQNRKTWMWAESVMFGVYGAALFLCPSFLVPGSSSTSLFFLVRTFASMILAGQYAMYVSSRTRDENVIGTLMWARILASIICLIVMGYSYSQKSEIFPDKTVYFDFLAFVLSALTVSVRMWQGQYRVGGREQKGYVSIIFRLFFLLSFLAGVSFLAFPSWVWKKPDGIETVLIRCMGASVFGGSFMWWYAPSFRDDTDRSMIFKTYFVQAGLSFVAACLAYFRDNQFSRQEFLSMHGSYIPVLLAALGQYLLWKRNSEANSSSYYLRSKTQ